jgi:hypothetical protein
VFHSSHERDGRAPAKGVLLCTLFGSFCQFFLKTEIRRRDLIKINPANGLGPKI